MKNDFAVAEEAGGNLRVVARGLDDYRDGIKWLKDNGDADKSYQIVVLKGATLTVEVETLKKRKLHETE
jgi:hypothetical protein